MCKRKKRVFNKCYSLNGIVNLGTCQIDLGEKPLNAFIKDVKALMEQHQGRGGTSLVVTTGGICDGNRKG